MEQKNIEKTVDARCIEICEKLRENSKYADSEKVSNRVMPKQESTIKAVAEQLADDDKVLFAYFTSIGICRKNKIKQKKSGIIKMPYFQNQQRLLVITENNLIFATDIDSLKFKIRYFMDMISDINYVYHKGLCFAGQVQLKLDGNMYITIGIRDDSCQATAREQFDYYKEQISGFLPKTENGVVLRENSTSIVSVYKRRSRYIKEKQLLSGVKLIEDEETNIYLQNIMRALLDCAIEAIDEYDSAEDRNAAVLLINENCICAKINSLIKYNYIIAPTISRQKINMEDYAIKQYIEQYNKKLDYVVQQAQLNTKKSLIQAG